MAKKHRTTNVTREQAQGYLNKAREFLRDSKKAMRDGQWNSAGLLAIHSTISASDALLGYQAGLRSTSPDHKTSADLLNGIGAGSRDWSKQINRFNRILGKKNLVEYEARPITEKEASYLVEQSDRFVRWVLGIVSGEVVQ